MTPTEAYAQLGRIGEWWDPARTCSEDGANLRLELRAGGYFCERLGDGGSVEHMRVVQARPDALLRLQGSLGPLQASAVAGTLTWLLKAVPGGTEIVQTYVVGGYIPDGMGALATGVDLVLGEQFDRLSQSLASRPR